MLSGCPVSLILEEDMLWISFLGSYPPCTSEYLVWAKNYSSPQPTVSVRYCSTQNEFGLACSSAPSTPLLPLQGSSGVLDQLCDKNPTEMYHHATWGLGDQRGNRSCGNQASTTLVEQLRNPRSRCCTLASQCKDKQKWVYIDCHILGRK